MNGDLVSIDLIIKVSCQFKCIQGLLYRFFLEAARETHFFQTGVGKMDLDPIPGGLLRGCAAHPKILPSLEYELINHPGGFYYIAGDRFEGRLADIDQ